MEILETIDCTPTWEALLLPMLDVYAQHKAKIKSSYSITPQTREAINHLENIKVEFKRMAQAADKWNDHVKTTKLNP
jgi:hypothetical protein